MKGVAYLEVNARCESAVANGSTKVLTLRLEKPGPALSMEGVHARDNFGNLRPQHHLRHILAVAIFVERDARRNNNKKKYCFRLLFRLRQTPLKNSHKPLRFCAVGKRWVYRTRGCVCALEFFVRTTRTGTHRGTFTKSKNFRVMGARVPGNYYSREDLVPTPRLSTWLGSYSRRTIWNDLASLSFISGIMPTLWGHWRAAMLLPSDVARLVLGKYNRSKLVAVATS